MSDHLLHLADLYRALERCMAAHPPNGTDHHLHPDANALADLWAPMHLGRLESMPLEAVAPHVREAYGRWAVVAEL